MQQKSLIFNFEILLEFNFLLSDNQLQVDRIYDNVGMI